MTVKLERLPLGTVAFPAVNEAGAYGNVNVTVVVWPVVSVELPKTTEADGKANAAGTAIDEKEINNATAKAKDFL